MQLGSLTGNRHLVMQPRFPPAVLPVVAVATGFVDCLIALPVLIVMTIVSGDIGWTMLVLPALFAVQFVFTCGIALIVSVVTVYLRDVRGIVTVGLTLLFYLTPVFYDVGRVPDRFESFLRLTRSRPCSRSTAGPCSAATSRRRCRSRGCWLPPCSRSQSASWSSAGLPGGVVDEL